MGSVATGFFSGGDSHPEALVSSTFLNSGFNPNVDWRYTLPHTIIKHTVYIHCNDAPFAPFDSIQWVYDNTRGRMKWYPFKSDNLSANADPVNYDLLLIPEIISAPGNDYSYFETDNSGWIDGGTIDYSGFDTNLSQSVNCPSTITNGYFPGVSSQDLFRVFINNNFELQYGDTPPYSLLTSFVRNSVGDLLTGYRNQNNQMEIPNYYKGIKHEYFINKGLPILDLTQINPGTKEIYNPSDVTLDPDAGMPNGTNSPIEVIFPEGYTFKTILGRFPSSTEVLNASLDPQNGYYNDQTLIPVPVNAADLHPVTYDPNDYPQVMWDDPATTDANGFYSDERFGYYYIANKATLIIENCVKIFDARFAVNSGGTMRFNDYSQILGFEDKANNYGRYKIRGEGGAILRNYSPVQYVQNGDIFQTMPLNYIATSQIIAGENVDPDTDQPIGIYEIKAGADVTFTAGDYIHLKDGFYVSGGDFHAVIDENLPVPAICYANNIQNGGNRTMQQPSTDQTYNVNGISVLPNPNHGTFTISTNGNNSIRTVSLFDITGRCVYYQNNLNAKSQEIQLNSDQSGLLIAKVENDIGEITMIKVIVE